MQIGHGRLQLSVCSIALGAVVWVLFALIAFFMKDLFSSLLGGGMDLTMSIEGVDETAVEAVGLVGDMIASMGSVLGVVFLTLAALSYFMARAAFKGGKWSPILSLLFTVLSLLGMAMNFDQSQIGGLVLNLLVGYICVMSIRSPYFNKG